MTIFRCLLIGLICTLPLWIQAVANAMGIQFQLYPLLQLILASVVQFGAGWIIYRDASRIYSQSNSWQDLIIALGSTAAYGLSIAFLLTGSTLDFYFISSSTLVTLFLLGRWLEKSIENEERAEFSAVKKAGFQLADKATCWYTIATLVLGILTALYWGGIKGVVYALGVLIIACPSMLGLAIPFILYMAKKMAPGLSDHDLKNLLEATNGKIKQNLMIVFVFHAFGIPIAMVGLLNSSVVTGTMVMSFLALLANSLLLGYWKPEGDR